MSIDLHLTWICLNGESAQAKIRQCVLYRLSTNETIVTCNPKHIAYFNMLSAMKNVDFLEHVEGQHFYQETNRQKSNVFSLRVKNSGLEFKLYSRDEIEKILNQQNGIETGILNGKYFIKEEGRTIDETKSLIELKMKFRKMFEDSIRKSIHRYIPVNTTLWKIDYRG